ncbi:MAG: tRNA (adenosine(37)-N6)-threonylcarbamoyltransferase complex ATPase subunit type 1 TsaE [Candidatus Komeilibacteria bacterium]|nr:tRNA (adenosine(37)-N6)-threonylcarbamoyltransferase complex ATPase subunit type 1 TsaE [Candidatus Komeilibacteria bacterium]
MKQVINNLEELNKLAQKLAHSFKGGEVIGLVGELGAGKTTFVQFLASALGVKEKVLSPTFVLMKVYATTNIRIKTLVHVDAYRLNNSEELKNIGLAEYLGRPDTLVAIEWADKVKDILPAGVLVLNFKEGSEENERIIEMPAFSHLKI